MPAGEQGRLGKKVGVGGGIGVKWKGPVAFPEGPGRAPEGSLHGRLFISCWRTFLWPQREQLAGKGTGYSPGLVRRPCRHERRGGRETEDRLSEEPRMGAELWPWAGVDRWGRARSDRPDS